MDWCNLTLGNSSISYFYEVPHRNKIKIKNKYKYKYKNIKI